MCLIALHRLRRVGPGPVTLLEPELPRVCLLAYAAGQARTRTIEITRLTRGRRSRGARARACASSGRPAFHSYDPGVSDRKIRMTVTLEPHLAAYAERLVEAGKAPSVSAVVN